MKQLTKVQIKEFVEMTGIMAKKYFLFVLSVVISLSAKSQINSHVLEFELHNKTFDSLRITTLSIVDNDKSIIVYGNAINSNTWRFELPDSIWQGLTHLVIGNVNKQKKVYEYIRFLYKSDKNEPDSKAQTLKYGWTWTPDIFVPDWNDVKICAYYVHTDTVYEDGATLISHHFVTDYSGTNVKAKTKYNLFSTFSSEQDADGLRTYKSYLDEYRRASTEYPDSRLLMIEMSQNINKYLMPEDALSIYVNFSERNKKSFYGQKVASDINRLGKIFENMTLRNILEGRNENIIQDSAKYNLICFTASWCPPCRAEVPLLKTIYNDLKGKPFELISISVDDTLSIPVFQRQIVEDSIPWRVLSAYPFIQSFFDRYIFNGVPTNMLVYPDYRIEFVDVRKESDRNKLYRLLL